MMAWSKSGLMRDQNILILIENLLVSLTIRLKTFLQGNFDG